MGRPETMPQESNLTRNPVRSGDRERVLSTNVAPYETSLISEYARLLLLAFVVPLVIWFSNLVLNHQTGHLCLVAGLILLATLVTSRGYQLFRIVLLIGMTINVFAFVSNPNETIGATNVASSELPVFSLLFCLGIASIFELAAWVKSNTRAVLLKTLTWGLLLIPAFIYVIGIPLFHFIWTSIEGNEQNLALRDPNWNVVNEASFRAAKFAVFVVFAYLGACLGSFLNVVAYCVPKGENIGLRDSKCPDCKTKLSRIDNLPIFSYLNLGAKCRSCKMPIPIRYLLVELIVATIFGSLFLYELVTGGANVPNMSFTHTGVLWVILYPKVPLISIYLFHSFFMCAVLVLSLIEWDKQPLRPLFSILVVLSFFISALIYMPIQPVPLLDHLSGISLSLSPWTEQLAKITIGCVIGAAIGKAFGKAFFSTDSYLVLAFLLTGLVLGWQALLQVSVAYGLMLTVVRFSPLSNLFGDRPTSILLAAIVVHHPFWQAISDLLP